ncbi:MAG: hypothetical protein KY475_01285 [Planctomycetes bacterium]|nr:hypothetical protein [Planctomycetota bacterium]
MTLAAQFATLNFMGDKGSSRCTRFGLRTLFVLTAVVALALAAPKWLHDWTLRQHEPIRKAIAEHHFRGNPRVVRQKDGDYVLVDVLGDQYAITFHSIGPVGFFRAEVHGSWDVSEGGGYSGHGMHYLLQRKDGRWVLDEARPVSIGCGARPVPEDAWDRLTEFVRDMREGDPTARCEACDALAEIAWEAPFSNKPQLDVVLFELTHLRNHADPQIRRIARHGLKAAGR